MVRVRSLVCNIYRVKIASQSRRLLPNVVVGGGEGVFAFSAIQSFLTPGRVTQSGPESCYSWYLVESPKAVRSMGRNQTKYSPLVES